MTANTDTPNTDIANPESVETTAPPLTIGAQYIKDLSFEAPSTPTVFPMMHNNNPDIQVNVDVLANNLQDNTFEVVLLIKAQCKIGDKTAFITELSYGGVFTINAAEKHIRPLLLIECPRMLFPFARNIIADVTRDGGFPPLMLSPLDFVEMYRKGVGEEPGADGNDSQSGKEVAAESAPKESSAH